MGVKLLGAKATVMLQGKGSPSVDRVRTYSWRVRYGIERSNQHQRAE